MASKLKKIFTNWQVLLLIFVVVMALTSIFTANPSNWFSEGVNIDSVQSNSSASIAGMASPTSGTHPLHQERVQEVNGQEIQTIEQFYSSLSTLNAGETVTITTDLTDYVILVNEEDLLEETIDLGIEVSEIPNSNLKKGLDLEGGTRVLLQPAEEIDSETLELTISNLYERLNVYGLSDIVISPAKDLAGEQYIIIEIAGASESEVRTLLEEQGKFEAKIANDTVFYGGDKDITYVCRSADCSGIDPNYGCNAVSDGAYACRFFFSISLSSEAAQRSADLTEGLTVEPSMDGDGYLSEDLVLYLDDVEVDRLRIGASLQGRATTEIQISGSGSGSTEATALDQTLLEMNRLQTIMITGSLPVQLEIVKMDTVSATLGEEFLDNLLLVAIVAILAVFAVIFARYRKLVVALPMSLIVLSEILMILGFAAAVSWNLDLAAFAGIIIAAGTGVDHLIIITDETLRGEKASSLKQRIKNAMFIVFGAYFTTTVGMLPLWFAGAGLLKGFAFTTIAGITLGVFIARPAYAAAIRILLEESEEEA